VSKEVVVATCDAMQDLKAYVPDMPDSFDVPDAAMFLIACACRWQKDKQFVAEMLAWFQWEMWAHTVGSEVKH
jgi:hypothetical protein